MKLLPRWSAAATALAAVATATATLAASAAPRAAPARAAAHAPGPADGPGLAPVEGAPDDVPPRGCAWFESSRELGLGLQVTEHERLDTAAGALPLDVWLAWHLAGFRAEAPALVASAPAAGGPYG
jgi:hypothetical protein